MISLEKIQKQAGRNYFVKVLIQDDNGYYVDISDRIKSHKDRVIGLPRIKINTDSKTLSHRFYASSGSMSVDNSDGFWDAPLTFSFTTENGTTATFKKTKAASEVVWAGRKIQFRLYEQYMDTFREKSLGTFLIDDIETSLGDDATLSIVDLSEPLRSRDASVVKNGMSWYQNRSISFLVQKLLELEYGTSTNGLISTQYDVDPRIDLETFDGSSTLSTIGPPPQLVDTDGDGIANLFSEKQMRTRAMVIAPSAIGSAFISNAKNTLYLACDSMLYSYSPATEMYRRLGDLSTLGLSPSYTADFKIHFLFYDDTRGLIIGYASTELPRDYAGETTLLDILQYYGTGGAEVIFKYTTATGLTALKTNLGYTGSTSYPTSYTGKQIGRKADYDSSNPTWKNYIGSPTGSNIFSPYRQYAIISEPTAFTGVSLEYADSSVVALSVKSALPAYLDSFYAFEQLYETSSDYTYTARYTAGSQGSVCYNRISSSPGFTHGALLKFEIRTSDVLYWKLFSPANNTFAIENGTANYITINSVNCTAQPISVCADQTTYKFYTGVIAFQDASGVTYSSYQGQIWSIDYSGTGSKSVLVSSTSPWLPVELFWNSFDSTHKLWVVYMNQQRLLSGGSVNPLYKIARINTSTGAQEDVTNLSILSNQPKGMVFDASGNLYFTTNQAGLLYKYSGTTLTLLDSGFPITEESPFLSAGLCVDTATRTGTTMLWGVSAGDIDNEAMENTTQSGKSYLFKYDKVISETVELADFSGLSVWDALGLLAQRANCSMGFDEEGNFFFKKREIDSTVAFTIDADKDEVFSITKDRGKDEIYNYVEITPYFATYKQPEYKGTIQTIGRSESEKENTVGDDEIVLKQTDLITKKIDMICIQDGNMSTSTPIFKYIVYEPVITGRFIADQTSATVMNIGSTFGGEETDYGIKPNYYLLYTDEDENEFYRRITAVDSASNTITLNSAITVKQNDEFSVYRRYRVDATDTSPKVWSDEGVTYITVVATNSTTQTVASVEHLSIGLMLSLGGIFTRITAINEDTLVITLDKAVTTTTGEAVKAYFAPAVKNTWYEVGNYNIQLMIATTATQTVFKQGDRITIDCPGLVLESDETSKQIAINNQSIEKHGKQQYPNINNRFLTRKLSKQLAQKVRTLYAFPKYRFKVNMPLSNYLDIVGTSNLARIDLRSQKLLPYRSGHTEPCTISSIEHNLSAGVTTLELKASSFY